MGAEDNGLTLEGLAHKLEALQRENSENTQRHLTFPGFLIIPIGRATPYGGS